MVCGEGRDSNSEEIARGALTKWMSWARRSRLEPFKRLAATLKEHFDDGVARGMLDGRSNAYASCRSNKITNKTGVFAFFSNKIGAFAFFTALSAPCTTWEKQT